MLLMPFKRNRKPYWYNIRGWPNARLATAILLHALLHPFSISLGCFFFKSLIVRPEPFFSFLFSFNGQQQIERKEKKKKFEGDRKKYRYILGIYNDTVTDKKLMAHGKKEWFVFNVIHTWPPKASVCCCVCSPRSRSLDFSRVKM